jgi:hypothetical protein
VGLVHGELGEREGVLEAGDDHLAHDPVDRLLVQPPEGIGGATASLDEAVKAIGVER